MNKKLIKILQSQHRAIVLIVVIVAISAVSFSANIVGRSFTSDDVAQQTMAHDLSQPGRHTLALENDTYVLKFPIYFAFDTLMHSGRAQLIFESLFFVALMVVLLVLWWKHIASSSWTSWVVFMWLMAVGAYWMSQIVNPNTRNVLLGLLLLLGLVIIRMLQVPPKGRRVPIYAVGLAAVAALLMYDDPYVLYFLLVPLFVALIIYYCKKRTYAPLFVALVSFLLCICLYKVIASCLAHFGIAIGAINILSGLTGNITAPHLLPHKILQVFNGYLGLVGASPTIVAHHPWRLPDVLLNSAVICLAFSSLYTIVRRHSFTLVNLWILMTFILTFSYLIITGVPVIETYRYSLILVPLTALLVAFALQRLTQSKSVYYHAGLTIVALSVVLNLIQGSVFLDQHRSVTQPNKLDYQIISAMDANDIRVAYGNYWVANISYYLSNYKDDVLPTICYDGINYLRPTLLDTQRFYVSSAKVGILVTEDLIIPTQSPKPLIQSCTLPAAIREFGKPQRIIPIMTNDKLLLYTHDPWGNAASKINQLH